MKYLLLIILFFSAVEVNAQGWSVSPKSVDIQFADILYLESICHMPHSTKTDTLPGTGFLIMTADSVIYMVTTKHQLKAALQNNTNALLQVGGGPHPKRKMIPLNLTGNRNRPLYALSDNEDLAIISLSNKQNKQVLNTLTKLECKPISSDSIDIADHAPRESLLLTRYECRYYDWARQVTAGLSPGTITTYSNKASTFLINHFALVSFAGAPVFKDDQIIGMVTHKTGLNSIDAQLKNAYQKGKSLVVLKAKYILPLLKKLQQQEIKS